MTSYTGLLTATKAESHIHLIIGSNPLASTRCGQSLSAGAHPVLLAPETSELHYALQNRVDDGQVRWVKEPFQDTHLFTLGRADVDHVVDAVFVTSNSGDSELGMQHLIQPGAHKQWASINPGNYRLPHIRPLQAKSDSRQHRRRPTTLLIYSPLDSY